MQGFNSPPVHHLSKCADANFVFREKWSKGIEPLLRRCQNRFALLMKERREQPEASMLGLKSASPFVNPTFTQNHNLVTTFERIDDHCPFFEGRSHGLIHSFERAIQTLQHTFFTQNFHEMIQAWA